MLTGGTDTHLLLVDLRGTDWTGKDAEERLAEVAITVNRNTIPFDERPPTVASGLRAGTPAATMRGFDEDDFREVGRITCEALSDGADLDALRERSLALCDARPLYPGFRGYSTLCQSLRSRTRSRSTSSACCGTSGRRRPTSAVSSTS